MNNNKLIRISSITKKLFVALLGAFLMVFLAFHALANLMILRHDGGDAYSAFCHFMGSDFIKVFEVILLGSFLLHIVLTLCLWWRNRGNRPVRYKHRSRTKTAKGSKLAVITGSLLLVCLLFHFYDFYFVKMNFVKGIYMVQTEELMVENPEVGISPEAQSILMKAIDNHQISDDMKWLRNISAEDKEVLQQAFPNANIEPDFYHQAREKFSHWHIVLSYLLFFALVGLHVRHGFESAFQTFGLNHYRYSKLIQVLGVIYCWFVCLCFAAVPLGVFFGL